MLRCEKCRTPACLAYRASLIEKGKNRFFGQLDELKEKGLQTDAKTFCKYFGVTHQLYYEKLRKYGKSHL